MVELTNEGRAYPYIIGKFGLRSRDRDGGGNAGVGLASRFAHGLTMHRAVKLIKPLDASPVRAH